MFSQENENKDRIKSVKQQDTLPGTFVGKHHQQQQ